MAGLDISSGGVGYKVAVKWDGGLTPRIRRAAFRVMDRMAGLIRKRARQIVQAWPPAAIIPTTPGEMRDASRGVPMSPWQPIPFPRGQAQVWIKAIARAFSVRRDLSALVWTIRNKRALSGLYEFGGSQTRGVWELRATGQQAAYLRSPKHPNKWINTGRTVEAVFPILPNFRPALDAANAIFPTLWANAVK